MNESLFRDWFMELFLLNTCRDVYQVSKNFIAKKWTKNGLKKEQSSSILTKRRTVR